MAFGEKSHRSGSVLYHHGRGGSVPYHHGRVDSAVTGPIAGHVNFDLCVRSCPPGFSTPEVLSPFLYSRL